MEDLHIMSNNTKTTLLTSPDYKLYKFNVKFKVRGEGCFFCQYLTTCFIDWSQKLRSFEKL